MSGGARGLPRYGRAARLALGLAAALGVLGAAFSLGSLWRGSRPLRAVNARPLGSAPERQREGSFSPDGRRVAFVSDVGGVAQVWVADLAGGAPARLTSGPEPCARPRWSPRDDAIVFERRGAAGPSLWSVPPVGGAPRPVATGAAAPAFSPDGTRLAFLGVPPRLLTCAADGSDPRPVAGVPPEATVPGDATPGF